MFYYGSATTPQGPLPALTFFTTALVATSITETSFDGPLAVNNILPSGDNAIPHGRSPASTEATGLLVAVSRTKTLCPRPVPTYSLVASELSSTDIGLMTPASPSLIGRITLCATESTSTTVPSFSAGIYALLESGRNATDRGRRPTLKVLIALAATGSITVTELVPSEVT